MSETELTTPQSPSPLTSDEVTPALACYGISKRFKSIQALDDVSISVPRGSIFGFLGPNGAGKSTLIRVFAGLIAADKGHFDILGSSSLKGHRVRNDMSALVDRADFYKNLSAYQNMKILGRITGHDSDEHINRLLDLLGLYERRKDKVKTFSQGMKQRLGLAQSLLPDPKLLVLDEPTTGLDPQGMHEIRDFILKIAAEQNVTIFLSSHLLHEVELICSDIALIFNGKLAAQGSMRDIFREIDNVTIELEVEDSKTTLAFLEKTDLVTQITPLANAISIEIHYNKIPELIRLMSAAKINIFSVSQRNRLENYFLSLMEGK
ncbi:MAG: ABC transporter ATP-binding protein [FCB group bacterium]|nr:ABC transporter ATP-binding protein [FCB group bacterium]MBL7027710.1 ABC transporter ATP-binding protein [Candidatus Neomarinimicrobiota bacterium]MBL7121043.1 ABC transporter ATP-binding protein [Candidatus Neomarinimicrobiota bacterium]